VLLLSPSCIMHEQHAELWACCRIYRHATTELRCLLPNVHRCCAQRAVPPSCRTWQRQRVCPCCRLQLKRW
jgi:hypothetical protein